MIEKIKQDVSGTAFVVNYSRSKMVNISKDTYAHLWVTPDSISLWNGLAKDVYTNDDLNVSLRNRFYLERLKKFINENEDVVFIGIASGFVNYPFLVEGDCSFIEFDLPNIVEFKKKKVMQWMQEGRLPARKIEYISIDLSDEKQRFILKEALNKAIGRNPSFVTMEGITYYLKREILNDIFRILKEVQRQGSIVAFDYWKPDTMEYTVMARLKEYLDKKFGYKDQEWDLFDQTYIKEIKGYIEIESADISKLELEYSETRLLQGKENKIPVYFSVLERNREKD
jgi:O-methyltransferase involved in polyketide biosynthesis